MALSAYPEGLPCPQSLTCVSAERRVLSDQPAQQARAISLERLAIEQMSFLFTDAEATVFLDWLDNTLDLGGAWFTATWPTPEGPLLTRRRRFLGLPQWSFTAGGFWTVSARCEMLGFVAPVAAPTFVIRWLDPITSIDGIALIDGPTDVNPVRFNVHADPISAYTWGGVVDYTAGTMDWTLDWVGTGSGPSLMFDAVDGGGKARLRFTHYEQPGVATLHATIDGVAITNVLTATVPVVVVPRGWLDTFTGTTGTALTSHTPDVATTGFAYANSGTGPDTSLKLSGGHAVIVPVGFATSGVADSSDSLPAFLLSPDVPYLILFVGRASDSVADSVTMCRFEKTSDGSYVELAFRRSAAGVYTTTAEVSDTSSGGFFYAENTNGSGERQVSVYIEATQCTVTFDGGDAETPVPLDGSPTLAFNRLRYIIDSDFPTDNSYIDRVSFSW